MKSLISMIAVSMFLIHGCRQKNETKMDVSELAISKIEKFIIMDKFQPDSNLFYPGLGAIQHKPALVTAINEAAKDFIEVSKNNPTKEKFLDKIKIGLLRFNPYYLDLDTEDQERICLYFQQLMDIVGLQSSNGLLNKWRYWLDPNDSTKKNK